MAVQASSFMREASSITAAPCHATAPSPPMQVMPASMPSSAPGLRLRSMPCHACSDTQMPSPSPPMQSKTLPWPRCLHPCLRAHRSRCASEMPASMPSSAPGLRLRSMPCHACSDTQMPSPSPHAFAPQFSPKTVAFAIASEMPASMPSSAPGLRLRSMPCQLAAIRRCLRHRPPCSPRRCLGPDACIHAFALTARDAPCHVRTSREVREVPKPAVSRCSNIGCRPTRSPRRRGRAAPGAGSGRMLLPSSG